MIFTFGDHELDEERFELRRGGARVELQPKVLELLFHLVRHRERVVAKQEILDAVWPDAVVTDGSLARAVSLARLALGDRDAAAGAITTVPRRGYRFHADVVLREHTEPPASPEPAIAAGASYVGRSELVARLAAATDSALRGAGRILFLVGEAGIGKTRTAELLADRARAKGARVASAWGLESSTDLPFRAWTRVLRAVVSEHDALFDGASPVHARALATILPELAASVESGPVSPPERDGEPARKRLFEAVREVVARASRPHPLVLVLDDFHEADADSFWLLEDLGRAIESSPVLAIVTCREDEAERSVQRARAIERLLRLSTLERWPLEGLAEGDVHAFVRARLGCEPDPSLLEALASKTGGNPLLLRESLRSLEARGLLAARRDRSAWETLLPAGIQHLVRNKLRHLTSTARDALATAAAVGPELDRELLARCLPDGALPDAVLREVEDAGLLLPSSSGAPRLRFPHALVREAVQGELAPHGGARRALHERIVAAFDACGDDSPESLADRAHHACEAAPRVAPARAVALATAAARHAESLRDFERAAGWYARALDALAKDASASDEERAALLVAQGAAETRAHGLERARPIFRRAAELARATGSHDLLAAAALGHAHRPNASGHGDPAVTSLLEEAAASPGKDAALRIRVLSRLAGEIRYEDRARAEALVEEAVGSARRAGDAAVLAQALDDSSFVRWSPDQPEGWIALNDEIVRVALASGDLELALSGAKGCVTGHLELGDVEAAAARVDACERFGAALRTPYARWLSAALSAMRALREGRLDTAETCIARAARFGERVESPDVALELGAQLVYLRLEQGRVAEVEAAVRAQVERFPDAPAWQAALARAVLATGRLLDARRELESLAAQGFDDVPRDRGWLPTLALASEVAAATGAAKRAERLEELLAPHARLCVVAGSGLLFYGSVQHHLGLLAATRADWGTALERFRDALTVHEKTGAVVWAARTRVATARALSGRDRSGDRRRAATLLAEAGEIARSLGLASVAEDVLATDARLGARPSSAPG